MMPRKATDGRTPGMYDPVHGARALSRDIPGSHCASSSHPWPAHAIATVARDTLSITALRHAAYGVSPDAASPPPVTPRLPPPKWPRWLALLPNRRDWRAIGRSARQDNRHSGPLTDAESL